MADRYANNEPMNHGEAARYYRLAADQGDIYAQRCLAMIYGIPGQGVPQDDAAEATRFRLAADQRFRHPSQLALGKLLIWFRSARVIT